MMDLLRTYVELGVRHIISPDALDHGLFLVALAAVYRARDWRAVLAVISAFTVGHSVTLALAVTHTLVLPPSLVEFLIPLTIVITSLENLVVGAPDRVTPVRWYRPALAALFGLVHGAGFAGYLESLMLQDIALPLVGFNIGIEIGQLIVLVGIGALFAGLDAALDVIATRRRGQHSGFTWRLSSVSLAVLVVAGRLAWERVP